MDYRQASVIELLNVLEREGMLSQEQVQRVRIRYGVIRALIKKEKASNPRYEPSAVEIVMASGATQAKSR